MLKFAVIGTGRMGKRHAFNLNLRLLNKVKLVAICDNDPAALKSCSKLAPKAKQYLDYREMLEKEILDGVIIATEHYGHEEIAIYCIEHGVNTLIEKPISVTTAAAKRIISASEANPLVKVGVSFNQRSNRMYRKAKELISSGKMGDIVRANFTISDWYRSQAYYNQGSWRASYNGEGGGALINQCIHQLDVLQWLIGMPTSVTSKLNTVNRNITVENDISAMLNYEDYFCMFSASTHEIKGTNRLEIACDKGKIVIGTLSMRVWKHKSERLVNEKTKKGYGFALSSLFIRSYGFFTLLADIIKGQQLRSIRAFANDIMGKGKMLATAKEGLNSISLINAIYLSNWLNKEISLPIDDEEYQKELNIKCVEETKQ